MSFLFRAFAGKADVDSPGSKGADTVRATLFLYDFNHFITAQRKRKFIVLVTRQ